MNVKRALWLLFIAFAIFFVMDSPAEAARLVKETTETAGQVFSSAFESISTFIRSL